MRTTEQPTYFGPSESPLFGILHLPSNRQVREGILFCASLGKESADSTRLQRILAEDLASRGFAVLRFDYLGTGDSAFEQTGEDALADWIASVGHAAEYLKSIGVQGISTIAHRIGCLIAEEALRVSECSFERLVFIDPVISGRRYLREQSALFKVTIGADATPPGTVSIVGALIAERAAKELGALALDNHLADSATARLFVLPTGETSARIRALAQECQIAKIDVERLNSALSLPMPLGAVEAIVSWFDRHAISSLASVRPLVQLRARMPEGAAQEGAVVETIEQIGPKELFAIRTVGDGQLPRTGMTTLFCPTFVDLHIGPTREWVELGRRIAAQGHEALRWDRAGLGDSPPIGRKQWHQVYRRADIADAIAAAQHANSDPARVCVVGVCSGAWYASHIARLGAADHAVLINPILWNWRASSSWTTEWNARRRLRTSDQAPMGETDQTESPRGLEGTAVRVRDRARRGFHRYVPRPLVLALSWMGMSRRPESVLSRLSRKNVCTTVILGPNDTETFTYQRGADAVQRLRRGNAAPVVVAVEQGDHGAYHQAILQAARRVIGDVLANAPGAEDGRSSPSVA